MRRKGEISSSIESSELGNSKMVKTKSEKVHSHQAYVESYDTRNEKGKQ